MLSSESKGIYCDGCVMNSNASEECSVKVKKECGIKRKNNAKKLSTGTVCMERNGEGIQAKQCDNQAVSGYNFKSQESSKDFPLHAESEEPEWVFKESYVDNKDLKVVSMGRFYPKEIKTQDTEIQNGIFTGVKPYTCTFCNKGFKQQYNLKAHQRIHTGVKPYTCTYCNKRFTEQSNLNHHERIHTGVKPYTCTYCNRGFTQRSSQKRHERIHTGVKPYTCTYCNKGFTDQSHLKKHERIHTGV